MNVTLQPELEKIINEEVKAGHSADLSEFVNRAVSYYIVARDLGDEKFTDEEQRERELVRLRQLKALDELVGWNEDDHPELKGGAAEWVAELRKEDEARFEKLTPPTDG